MQKLIVGRDQAFLTSSFEIPCSIFVIHNNSGWQPHAQLGDWFLPVMQSAIFDYKLYYNKLNNKTHMAQLDRASVYGTEG